MQLGEGRKGQRRALQPLPASGGEVARVGCAVEDEPLGVCDEDAASQRARR